METAAITALTSLEFLWSHTALLWHSHHPHTLSNLSLHMYPSFPSSKKMRVHSCNKSQEQGLNNKQNAKECKMDSLLTCELFGLPWLAWLRCLLCEWNLQSSGVLYFLSYMGKMRMRTTHGTGKNGKPDLQKVGVRSQSQDPPWANPTRATKSQSYSAEVN